jgi:hypothetical protein
VSSLAYLISFAAVTCGLMTICTFVRIGITCFVVFADGGLTLDEHYARTLQFSHLHAHLHYKKLFNL